MSKRKREVPRLIVIEEPVYRTCVAVISDCDRPGLIAYMERRWPGSTEGQSPENDGSVGTVMKVSNKKTGDVWRILWVRHLKKTPEEIGCLAHEVLHLVLRILEDKGVPVAAHMTGEGEYRVNGDEAACYLTEFYMMTVLRKI